MESHKRQHFGLTEYALSGGAGIWRIENDLHCINVSGYIDYECFPLEVLLISDPVRRIKTLSTIPFQY